MSQTPRMFNALSQFVVSKRGVRISPPLCRVRSCAWPQGAGVGYLTQRLFLRFSNMTFSALCVLTLSLGVEVTDPTPDPSPWGAGMLHSEWASRSVDTVFGRRLFIKFQPHRSKFSSSVTPAWRWYDINNPERVTEQRHEVYEVVILPPIRGSFNIKPRYNKSSMK